MGNPFRPSSFQNKTDLGPSQNPAHAPPEEDRLRFVSHPQRCASRHAQGGGLPGKMTSPSPRPDSPTVAFRSQAWRMAAYSNSLTRARAHSESVNTCDANEARAEISCRPGHASGPLGLEVTACGRSKF